MGQAKGAFSLHKIHGTFCGRSGFRVGGQILQLGCSLQLGGQQDRPSL